MVSIATGSHFVVALLAAAAPAGDSVPAQDYWRVKFGHGKAMGFEHTVVTPVEAGGRKCLRTVTDGSFRIEAGDVVIGVVQRMIYVEDESGQIVEADVTSTMQGQTTITSARVHGDKADVSTRIAGPVLQKTIDWSKEWLGPQAFERVQREQHAAGKKEFTVKTWMADQGEMTLAVQIHGKEQVELPLLGKRELLRATQKMTSAMIPEVVAETWADDTLREVASKYVLLGIESFTVTAGRAAAFEALAPAGAPELFSPFCAASNVRLQSPHSLDEIVVRARGLLSMKPLPFPLDERQEGIEKKTPGDQTLRVTRGSPPKVALPLKPAGAEEQAALAASPGIDSALPEVKAFAQKAVGSEKDAWTAATKLEKAVFDVLAKKEIGKTFDSAAQALKMKAGDASEHAQLLAAACRAAGIPARVAVGLCCFDQHFVPHLWTEVALDGKWYGLDATVAVGGIGPTHLRVASDDGAKTPIPDLFAKVRDAMQCEIEVVSYKSGGTEVKASAATAGAASDAGRVKQPLGRVSFAVPAGFDATVNTRFDPGDDAFATLARKGAATAPITVTLQDERYGAGLNEMKARLALDGMTQVKATDKKVDGRAARVFKGRLGEKEQLVGAIQRDTTLVVVAMPRAGPDDDKVFEALLASFDLDG